MKKIYIYTLKTIAFAVLLLAHVNLLATETGGGSIKGHVLTADGKPISHVTVTIKELNKATNSNTDGSYYMGRIKPGTYTLCFTHIGIQTRQQQVTVIAAKTIIVDLTLTEQASQLKEVSINRSVTVNEKPIGAGKAGISYLDMPQSGGVVTSQVIHDQQINRLGDAIRNVSGVTLTQTRGGVGETYTARGYSTGITGGASSVFLDGTLINTAGFPEASILESVEVLKGSSALLYGNVSSGLIINMVTKKPQFTSGGEVSMRYGSNNMYKPTVDVYGPISKNLAFRMIGVYENDGSYRNSVHTERAFAAPSFLYNIGKKTTVLLEGNYLKESLTPDFGIGSVDTGRAISAAIPRSQYINTAWAYSHMDQYTGILNIKHKFTDSASLNLIASAQGTKINSYQASLPNAVSPTGNWYRGVARANTTENDYAAQLNYNTKFNTASIRHQVLLGTDFQGIVTLSNAYSFTGLTKVKGVSYDVYDLINTINPNAYSPRTDMPAALDTALTRSPLYRFGYYGQDLISLSDKFKVLAGLRYTIQKTVQTYITNYLTNADRRGATGTKFDRAFSPKFSLIYQPTSNTSVYAGYSNNFATNTGIDIATKQAMSPSVIDQYDAGIKNELFDGKIAANVSIYRIINHDLSVVAPVDTSGKPNSITTFRQFSGQTTSDGIEIDISGNLSKNLYFVTGYAYNHAYYSHTSGVKGSYIEGEPLVINPSNTANGSVFYTFDHCRLRGLKLGASVFYTGFRYAGYNNTIGQTQQYNRLLPVGGFTTLDLSAGYTYKKLSLLAAVTNVTNSMNYLVHDNYSVTPIAPTQFLTTLAYKF